jgi:two-component system chemotaxis response regulator CheY
MDILVVDDQMTLGLALSLTLSQLGHQPRLVSSGHAAWDLIEREDWRLVITDWIMPEMDGLELCRRIRARQNKPYNYVIMLTCRTDRNDRLAALAAGADDFLAKPVDEDELRIRLTIARRILGVQADLEEKNARLSEQANTDPLTGLANRRQFHKGIELALSQVRRGVPCSVLVLDIDHFKSYNDSFGHAAGDEVLCTVAEILQQNTRPTDLVARMGGEEFVVVLTGAGPYQALITADRLRRTIATHAWRSRPVTASFGIASASLPEEACAVADLLEKADRALYHSKHSGRNRVTRFSALEQQPLLCTP